MAQKSEQSPADISNNWLRIREQKILPHPKVWPSLSLPAEVEVACLFFGRLSAMVASRCEGASFLCPQHFNTLVHVVSYYIVIFLAFTINLNWWFMWVCRWISYNLRRLVVMVMRIIAAFFTWGGCHDLCEWLRFGTGVLAICRLASKLFGCFDQRAFWDAVSTPKEIPFRSTKPTRFRAYQPDKTPNSAPTLVETLGFGQVLWSE